MHRAGSQPNRVAAEMFCHATNLAVAGICRLAIVTTSALCKAFHKTDYAKSLIMESSWVDWR